MVIFARDVEIGQLQIWHIDTMIYLLIGFIFFIIAYIYDSKGRITGRSYVYILEAVILSLLFGLRYHVGGDSFQYEADFSSLPSLNELKYQEWNLLTYQPGWYVFNAIIKSICDKFWFFCLVHSSFVIVVVFWFIDKYTKHIFWGSFIFCTLFSLNYCTEILRESIAICFFLLGFPSLENKKWLKYYVFVLVAFSLHISAIVTFFIPVLFPLFSKEIKMGRLLLISSVIVVISAFSFQIIDNVLNQFSAFGSVTTRVLFYSNATQVGLSSNDGIGGTNISKKWLLSVMMSLFAIYLLKESKLKNPKYYFIFNVFFILTLLSFAFGLMATRLLNYFKLFYFIILINIMFDNKATYKSSKIIKNGACVVVLYFYAVMILHWFDFADVNAKIKVYQKFYPYSSIIAPHQYIQRERHYFVY